MAQDRDQFDYFPVYGPLGYKCTTCGQTCSGMGKCEACGEALCFICACPFPLDAPILCEACREAGKPVKFPRYRKD